MQLSLQLHIQEPSMEKNNLIHDTIVDLSIYKLALYIIQIKVHFHSSNRKVQTKADNIHTSRRVETFIISNDRQESLLL